MNLVKIIRSLRDLKILMNNSLMSVGMKHHIRNSRKNIINLEEGAKVNVSSTVDIDQESTQSEFQTSV